ncbi:unnamed protein product [Protopolystoma xenopodis]|uniref:Uncharacterized protein n=1 Tax=Protopolystoma xenopodis TaxID=117903 RepID=A0A448WN56_9PLAT|nr:unnamed protein product [Protopolystoma xenopodis]
MEWLMGKARGVSRNLMSSNSSSINEQLSVISPTSCSSNSYAISISPKSESDTKFANSPPKPPERSGLRSGSPSTRLSPPFAFTGGSALSRCSSPVQPNSKNALNVSVSSIDPNSKPLIDSLSALKHPLFISPSSLRHQLPLFTATSVDFSDLVEPYDHAELHEWLATNTINLFENLSTIFDALYELCVCPSLNVAVYFPGLDFTQLTDYNLCSQLNMSLSTLYEEEKGKKSKGSFNISSISTQMLSACTARQAIDTALSCCHDLMQSPRIFPVRYGEDFSPDFPLRISGICKSLLVCISHLYLAHFHHIEQLELLPHLNTLSKHFFSFTQRFSILCEKDFEPLAGLHRLLTEVPAPALPTQQNISGCIQDSSPFKSSIESDGLVGNDIKSDPKCSHLSNCLCSKGVAVR